VHTVLALRCDALAMQSADMTNYPDPRPHPPSQTTKDKDIFTIDGTRACKIS